MKKLVYQNHGTNSDEVAAIIFRSKEEVEEFYLLVRPFYHVTPYYSFNDSIRDITSYLLRIKEVVGIFYENVESSFPGWEIYHEDGFLLNCARRNRIPFKSFEEFKKRIIEVDDE